MTDTVVLLQPAFVLQHRRYRETSLIIDIFTRDYGVVSILAKGVRKAKSKSAGLLLPFKALTLSYCGKTELKLLTEVELQLHTPALSGIGLYCGFYVNELISKFCHKHDPHPDVYQDYAACLLALATAKVPLESTNLKNRDLTLLMQLEAALRIFELNLLQHIGLAFITAHDAITEAPINADGLYHFRADQGVTEHPSGIVSGKTIIAMHRQSFSDIETLQEAKLIMRTVINFHLQGKPLKSRTVLSKIYQRF